MKSIKKYLIASLCLLLMSCGSTKNSSDNEVSKNSTETNKNAREETKNEELKMKKTLEDVFKGFVNVLENHKNYAEDKGKAEVSRYLYTLAYMDNTGIPVLLLQINTDFQSGFQAPSIMKIFAFIDGNVKETEYSTSMGYGHSILTGITIHQLKSNDGIVKLVENQGGTYADVHKLQLENKTVKVEEILDKLKSENIDIKEKINKLTWYEIDDYSALENMLDDPLFIKQFNENYLSNLKEGQKNYKGTIKIFTEQELMKFLNITQKNPYRKADDSLYVIFVLDNEQDVKARTVNNPNGKYWKVGYFSIFNQYKGRGDYNNRIELFKKYKDKKVTVVVDENISYVPSNISIPPFEMINTNSIRIID